MNSLAATRVGFVAPSTLRLDSRARADGCIAAVANNCHSPFIAWLRQLRRLAWMAIFVCCLFRIGDAFVSDIPGFAGAPAIAAAG